MAKLSDPVLASVFQPNGEGPLRAVVVAGACGNVGFGKLGQLARLVSKHEIPVFALDLSPAVLDVKSRLREAFGKKFSDAEIDSILACIRPIQGSVDDLPADVEIGFVFEAVPERLSIKRPFYEAIRKRDRDPNQRAFIFSATSGLTTQHLFAGLEGADRCGVLHPFFPHLTNKLWELPTRGAVTSSATVKTISRLFGNWGMNLVDVADVPAFAADRIFCGMMLEAVRIHNDLGLSPAQVDDACKQLLGTSPFFVHNLIAGSNYLSGHCMELCHEELDSSLFSVPEIWRPYLADPKKQWPYERGAKCPADMYPQVRQRMLGMLISLTAYMIEHKICHADVLNFLCENALAFRIGIPALIEQIGNSEAISLAQAFLAEQKITRASEVAPLAALEAQREWVGTVYVETKVVDGVGLLSIKKRTVDHVFIHELGNAIDRLQNDAAVKAIVVAPDGRLSREFGHGADPNAFMPVLGNKQAASDLIARWKQVMNKLRGGKPTVAALVGRVLGGGLEFASSCHARVAASGTLLGQPEPTVGVIPGLGGCHLIHRASAAEFYPRINELLLTGHTFGVEEAQKWGFVSEVVPVRDLPQASMDFARKLGSGDSKLPAFRQDGVRFQVDRKVNIRNEAGTVLDAELRDLLARTIEDVNALPYAEGSQLEHARATESLCLSSSAVGVPALLRGKQPAFQNPLSE